MTEFTIILPCRNSQEFVEKSIYSVLQQENQLQYLIIDGLSSDNTLEIVYKFQKTGVKIISEEDTGQTNAINKGINLAKGNIINWLNSDDYYEPDALKIVGENFDENTIAVAGRSRVFDERGTKYFSNGTDVYPDNLPKTLGWARIDQPETFFRREVWDKVGLLNEDLHYVFDKEWWIRYLFHYGLEGFKKIPDVLVNFRHHVKSKTVSRKKDFVKESRRVYAAYARYIDEFRIEDKILETEEINDKIGLDIPNIASVEIIRPMLHYHLLLLGNEYYTQNEKVKANMMLDLVEEKYLDKPEANLLRKLRFRNKVPSKIIEIARKISSG